MDKSLPADINAERATLGSILLDRDAIIPVAPWLASDYFYLEKHGLIFNAQVACYNRRVPPDLVNVTDELRRKDELEAVGGVPYLLELSNSVPTSVHVEYYARIVERTALLRRLIIAGGKIAALGYDETQELEAALDQAESELFAVSQRRTTDGFIHIGAVVDSFFDQISQMQERGGEVVGLKTGFNDFDKLTGGLQRSDLLILAARPATGKTSLALNIAYNAAKESEACVAIFSLEMSRDQLMQRILATETGVDMQKLRTGQIRDSDLQLLTEALGKLSTMSIYIDDSPGASIMDVRSKCRRLQAEAGIDLIIIDYLQLMQGGGKRDGNRVQEISEISRGLKALAREINVPVIALSQLSRAVESRTTHVPMLSDLRESGCLTGDTQIYLPDQGHYVRIDQLVGQQGFNVLALNQATWKLESRPVTNAFTTGTKPVFKLRTKLGRSIRATANHKFLTIDGWKRLDELHHASQIAIPQELTLELGSNNPQTTIEWETIVSIEPDGVEPVYDLTVDTLHNFVANNIIVHNSIEQDADIVMFIYREELYDPETDKKGIAEIHLAKHRNGPTGIVPLRFFRSTTKFANLETYRQPEGY
ncbi:replicative DNA helicase [Herpetosiphon sp. NSE202]|uniref:replicative DNA helicase n=1 Tax=Herpetosiphon sp. NSE202 TaxID=3351349 RepID=UPI00362C15BD